MNGVSQLAIGPSKVKSAANSRTDFCVSSSMGGDSLLSCVCVFARILLQTRAPSAQYMRLNVSVHVNNVDLSYRSRHLNKSQLAKIGAKLKSCCLQKDSTCYMCQISVMVRVYCDSVRVHVIFIRNLSSYIPVDRKKIFHAQKIYVTRSRTENTSA